MGSLEIRANRYSKVTGESLGLSPAGTTLRAIIEVAESNYVPQGVTVRERIDSKIFTAEFPVTKLQTLEGDTSVKSIALAEKVSIVE